MPNVGTGLAWEKAWCREKSAGGTKDGGGTFPPAELPSLEEA